MLPYQLFQPMGGFGARPLFCERKIALEEKSIMNTRHRPKIRQRELCFMVELLFDDALYCVR
jgi:hypothetical protein